MYFPTLLESLLELVLINVFSLEKIIFNPLGEEVILPCKIYGNSLLLIWVCIWTQATFRFRLN